MDDARPNEGIDPHQFAVNARAMLLEDRANWRNFGIYWFLVKALLRKLYSEEELPLGLYEDAGVIDLMPRGLTLTQLLSAAAEEYAFNATLGAGRRQVEDPEGQMVTLVDPDMAC